MPEHSPNLAQGSICTLNKNGSESGEPEYFVVVSHDCDLNNSNESTVELMRAVIEAKRDSTLTHGKNVRRLQIEYLTSDDVDVIFEFSATSKFVLSIDEFRHKYDTVDTYSLPPKSKATYKSWLASRYNRSAFPDAFNDRLRAKVSGKSIIKSLEKIAENLGEHVTALFFDLGTNRFIELSSDVPYDLEIFVIYASESILVGGPERADLMATQITECFESFEGKLQVGDIRLMNCSAYGDLNFPLGKVRDLDKFSFDYISARNDDVFNPYE